MTSAARDLMDTGTPGKWFDVEADIYASDDGFNVPHVGEISDGRDRAKALRAVNALPLVDALIEATGELVDHMRACGGYGCPGLDRMRRRVAAARDALEAALRGEGE